VIFWELANTINECKRTTLTNVTLMTNSQLQARDKIRYDLQYSKGEHDHDHQLLLDISLQYVDLFQRKDEDNKIDDDVEDCAHPALDMDVVA
jgi:hypothetical protein